MVFASGVRSLVRAFVSRVRSFARARHVTSSSSSSASPMRGWCVSLLSLVPGSIHRVEKSKKHWLLRRRNKTTAQRCSTPRAPIALTSPAVFRINAAQASSSPGRIGGGGRRRRLFDVALCCVAALEREKGFGQIIQIRSGYFCCTGRPGLCSLLTASLVRWLTRSPAVRSLARFQCF